ncbi:MAG: DUF2461 domain-containing protein [bacterium]|nr:DUF2461 domain-containing protein [bacterium]
MKTATEFMGFPKETVEFFIDLKKNNNRAWFNEHRQDYEEYVLAPAQHFVMALAERLKKDRPDLIAIPRIDRAIFRLNRDVRFSRDKSPYKTHLGIWLWEGERPKLESPGFYFHLEPPDIMLSSGIYIFSPDELALFRKTATRPGTGNGLKRVLSALKKKGYLFGGKYYKRIPRGYTPDSLNADLLLYNGFYTDHSRKIPKLLHSAKWADYCYKVFRDMVPLHEWFIKMLKNR